jgi:hypothetical protein
MDFPSRTFADFLRDMAAAVQGLSARVMDFSPGSVLRSLLEANAAVAMWMQWVMLAILQNTRATTSNGQDLDSWMLDFGVFRLPAIASSVLVSVSLFASTRRAVVPSGMIVKTTGGDKKFAVIEDTTSSVWSIVENGYILAPGVLNITVPVECMETGASGNVQTGIISLIASSVPGVDAVSNNRAFTNGLDAEDDAALRLRFHNYLASRSRATLTAVSYAISELRQGLRFVIEENRDASGADRFGHFVAIVDDGSGQAPLQLLDQVTAAIDRVRPVGSMFSVIRATVANANVSLMLDVRGRPTTTDIGARLSLSIVRYFNSLSIGEPLSATRIAEIAYRTDENIANVRSVSINGASADLIAAGRTIIRAGTVTAV